MDKAASDDGRHSDMSKGGATELTSPSGFGFSPESQARGCSGRGMTEGTGTVPGEQGQMVYPESPLQGTKQEAGLEARWRHYTWCLGTLSRKRPRVTNTGLYVEDKVVRH